MGALARMIGRLVGKKSALRQFVVQAKYDAAQTTAENRKHWQHADHLSPDAAASADVRRTLRSRSRYEVANNSYARGIVLTLANDVVGTGPTLQLQTEDAELNRQVEKAFAQWARAIDLAGKLRTMRMAKATDGESFALLTSNPAIDSPVNLDVQPVEADRITAPQGDTSGGTVDGVKFDSHGNPTAYFVLRSHPGGDSGGDEGKFVAVENVIHWFRSDRPGQHRGVPDILPALPLFAKLRRYTNAVILAAEAAANLAVLMRTNLPASGEAAEVPPLTEMEFSPNMAIFTPEGWEPYQLKAEQPSTTYDMFKREVLNEIARCLNMPYNIAACNSSGYNYSSGRLDHQTYFKSIRVEQGQCEGVVLDRILLAWFREAMLQTDFRVLRSLEGMPSHQWFWPGNEHVDPAKEATAQEKKLNNNTTTLAHEYALQGKDWEQELRQRAKEKAVERELKLTEAEASPSAKGGKQDNGKDREEKNAQDAA